MAGGKTCFYVSDPGAAEMEVKHFKDHSPSSTRLAWLIMAAR